ncbi:MAG: hypothetical protein PHR30_10150 [Gallionellaceae bacterium]|nr:hypothetical protein [Gallionellaceae bacterium]
MLAFTPYTRRPLAVFLAASMGLHLFALGLYQPATPARPAPWRDTPLQWVDLEPLPSQDVSGPQIARPVVKTKSVHAGSPPAAKPVVEAVPATAASSPDTPGAEKTSSAPAADISFTAPPPRRRNLSTAEILELAREIARQSPSEAMPPDRSVLPEDRAILPGLDRALRRKTPGERRYADGMIKMVTPSGQVYCLKPPPEFARDGPAEALAVPTNCP